MTWETYAIECNLRIYWYLVGLTCGISVSSFSGNFLYFTIPDKNITFLKHFTFAYFHFFDLFSTFFDYFIFQKTIFGTILRIWTYRILYRSYYMNHIGRDRPSRSKQAILTQPDFQTQYTHTKFTTAHEL